MLITGLAACSAKENVDPATFPDGAQVVADAATAMGELTAVHLQVDLDPALGDNPAIKRADLDLTSNGDSKGDLEMQPQGGAMTTLKMVALGDGSSFIYLDGTGWIKYSILDKYDTAKILRKGEGLSAQMGTATNAKTVGSEKVGGVDTWKVELTYDNATIESLVPAQLGDNVLTGDAWIAKDTHYVMKATVHVPATEGVNPEANVTMTLSHFNEAVEIVAPVLD